MVIKLVCFTGSGARISKVLADAFSHDGDDAEPWLISGKCQNHEGVRLYEKGLACWTELAFSQADAIFYIGATGIAVRSIAPYIRDKYTDPAVIVVDEAGKFCISLLSGHVGGANELAKRAGLILGAMPVITTATDTEGRFAVDLFAKGNALDCVPKSMCKEISAAVLEGEKVGFISDYPIDGTIPYEIESDRLKAESLSLGIYITSALKNSPFKRTLFLIPRSVWLGIGCRRGISSEAVADAVKTFLQVERIHASAIAGIASCDIKKDETGLCAYADKSSLPLRFFTAEELAKIEGEFEYSEFVDKTVGVGNVCERSAVAAAGDGGKLIKRKYVHKGVTVAAAEEYLRIHFS